jgi:branched-chain amino acid transport system substrate-binding protein
MYKSFRSLTAVAAIALVATGCAGGPQQRSGKLTGNKIVIAVLTDQSAAYSALSGKNSVEAVKMAVEDFKARYGENAVTRDIEIIDADHENKPDIASRKANEMYDRDGADIVLDVPGSSAALAVADVAKQKKKLFFDITAATSELTGAKCNRYTFHYAYDTWVLAQATGRTLTNGGAKSWYIVYPNYAFGQDMTKSFTEAITTAGGRVVASEGTPFPNQSGDFSTQLLKAAALDPKPDTLGVMQAGADLVNIVKQYNEFKLKDKGINLAVGLMFITDIDSLSPDALSGTTFTDVWYWNFDATNRAFADRFLAKTGVRPTFAHAGNYSAAMQYLEAVQAAGTDDADAVVEGLEGKAVNDLFLRNGRFRAEDHSVTHDVYLARVKPSSEVTQPWDYEEILTTISGDRAFREPPATCKM